MKFQVTFEVENEDEDAGLTEEQFAEQIEGEVEILLMDGGYSNVDCKLID